LVVISGKVRDLCLSAFEVKKLKAMSAGKIILKYGATAPTNGFCLLEEAPTP
jgi:hypothetical protein